MKSAIAFTTFALLASHTIAAEQNPVLGDWKWRSKDGKCLETHSYRADGTATIKSGEEVLEKTYTISKLKSGGYFIESTVVSTNGLDDCTGSPTPVGAKASVHIMLLKGGDYFTCAGKDGLSCYGGAKKILPPNSP